MSRSNSLPVFKTDLFNDSDDDKQFCGFHAEDNVLREAVADWTSTLMKVVSIRWTGLTDSYDEWDEVIAIGTDGVGEHGQSTIDSP